MKLVQQISKQRQKRRWRVRNRIRATTDRLRLSVFRSNKHMYAQIIDDNTGRTLVSASTVEPELAGDSQAGGNTAAATKIGQAIAARAQEQGIKAVVFDRGQYRYHGRVAALAEAARAGGLEF